MIFNERLIFMDSDDTLAVGIDFGTSNSTVAYFKNGKYKFLEILRQRFIKVG